MSIKISIQQKSLTEKGLPHCTSAAAQAKAFYNNVHINFEHAILYTSERHPFQFPVFHCNARHCCSCRRLSYPLAVAAAVWDFAVPQGRRRNPTNRRRRSVTKTSPSQKWQTKRTRTSATRITSNVPPWQPVRRPDLTEGHALLTCKVHWINRHERLPWHPEQCKK